MALLGGGIVVWKVTHKPKGYFDVNTLEASVLLTSTELAVKNGGVVTGVDCFQEGPSNTFRCHVDFAVGSQSSGTNILVHVSDDGEHWQSSPTT